MEKKLASLTRTKSKQHTLNGLPVVNLVAPDPDTDGAFRDLVSLGSGTQTQLPKVDCLHSRVPLSPCNKY